MKKILTVVSLLLSLNAMSLEVHEWGTFTSVVGSNGKVLAGLHHEEEALPHFVYDLSKLAESNPFTTQSRGNNNGNPPRNPPMRPPRTRGFFPESMDQMPIPTFTERITQKMETPVLYFYNDKEINVQVRVDFPKGIISQWYPKATSYNPSKKAEDGFAVWDIKVLNQKKAQLLDTSDNSIWNPSRKTQSNIIQVGNELEKLIFYRGLADFGTSLKVTNNGEVLTLKNTSEQKIKGIILLENRGNKQNIIYLNELEANAESVVHFAGTQREGESFSNYDLYLNKAKRMIIDDLIASGLFEDEAHAMVGTWEKGYFKTEGLRILYVLSREETDKILPIEITPAPSTLVRTLVGRIEVLTPEVEKATEGFVIDQANSSLSSLHFDGRHMEGLGHFPEPKLQRLLETTQESKVIEKAKQIIQSMNRGMLNN